MNDELTQKAEKAVLALQELKKAALDHFNVAGDKLDTLEMELDWSSSMSDEELARQVYEKAEMLASKFHPFRHNHVYCYACGDAGCMHAVQPKPGEVFAGYDCTGTPIWKELFRTMLALDDKRTDLLFRHPPVFLSHVMSRTQINEQQLVSFGKNSLTYRVWGQVIAGYVTHGEIRAAITIQIVETNDHDLHLQVLADTRILDALAEAPANENSVLYRLHHAIEKMRKVLSGQGQTWKRNFKTLNRKTFELKLMGKLRHLARSIERKGRQDKRRTEHAKVRAQEKRPVHKAQDDLVQAAHTSFFHDRFRHTIVVIGKGARAHVFNETGRHITSLTIGRDDLERRQAKKRYVLMNPEDIDSFKESVLSQLDTN